jgi:hypothetical protein
VSPFFRVPLYNRFVKIQNLKAYTSCIPFITPHLPSGATGPGHKAGSIGGFELRVFFLRLVFGGEGLG